MIDKR